MRRSTRRAAAALVALLAIVSWAPQAWAVGNSDAAKRAAQYVASQSAAATDAGQAADSLIALAASGDLTLAPQATQLLAVMNNGAAAYAATAPEAAAKLVVASVAVGQNPTSVGGMNLVDTVRAGIHEDGSFGATPGAAASAWGMLALARAGQQVPASMLAYLVQLANGDGGFGKNSGLASDAASTGLALQGLATQTDSISARDTSLKAVAWATAQQQADGSWAGDNPVVATSLLGSGLQAAGQAQPKAVQYLVTQQLANGAMPLGGNADLAATQHATLLLGDTSYVAVSAPGLISQAPATSTAPTTAAPATSSEATPSTTPSPAPSPLRGDGNNILWILLPIVLLGLLGAGFYYLFIRPGRVQAKKEAAEAAKAAAANDAAATAPSAAAAPTAATDTSAAPGSADATPASADTPDSLTDKQD